MQIKRSPRRRLQGVMATMLTALALSWSAVAASGDGDQWRLTVDLSSFHDGHIVTFDEIVEVKDGHFNGGFQYGNASVALTFWVAGDTVTGNMAVDAGRRWNTVTIKYDGPVVKGVFFRELVGPATYETFGLRHRETISRNVDVAMRLERR